MQKNGYPRYEITIPQRTRHRRDTGHGPGRGIGQGSSATAARYPAQYQARAGFRHRAPQRTRHRPELRPAEPFSAPAAACRSVIRPGYSARTRPRPAGSTRGLPPRISDPARVRTSRKARFAANIRTTSVSYTHLTLPTSEPVEISVVAVPLKKQNERTKN